jgi:hypothetical protein
MEKLSRMKTMALLRSVKRNREPGWRKGAARVFPRGSRSGLAWGGDKRRRDWLSWLGIGIGSMDEKGGEGVTPPACSLPGEDDNGGAPLHVS